MATLTKEKRAGTWKARVRTVDGGTKTLSIKATNRAEAKKLLKQSRLPEIEAAAKSGDLQTRGLNAILGHNRVTASDAATQFQEWQQTVGRAPNYMHQASSVLKRFSEQMNLAGVMVPDITERHVYDYINSKEGGNANWRRTQLGILRAFFEFASARGLRLGNPAKLVEVRMDILTHAQKETRERRPFSDSEIRKIVAVVDNEITRLRSLADAIESTEMAKANWLRMRADESEFWKAAIILSRYTGLRIGDICQLEWETFTVPGKIIVWTDKRNKRVVLPMDHPDLVDAVASIKPLSNQYVFPDQRDAYLDPKRRANFSTYFRRWAEEAGVKGKTFHDLRSSFISDAAKRGVPIDYIRKLAGHSDEQTTRGYIK
jgi:integrase